MDEVGGTLHQPAADALVVLVASVMAGGEQISADLAGGDEQLVELQMIVAETARDRRASREIVVDEGPNHIVLEARLLIDDVVRNAKLLGDVAGVVDVVDGAAAALHGLGHALVTGEAALVPELERETDDAVALLAEHGRDGGGIDSARHGYGYGLVIVIKLAIPYSIQIR